MKEMLARLSFQLRALQKGLLRALLQELEEDPQRPAVQLQALCLATHDPRFEWLRRISFLITEIDQRVQTQEEIELLDVRAIFDEVSRTLNGTYPDFFIPYRHALEREPHLYEKQDSVLSVLEELRPFARNMHEMHSENEIHKFKEI